MTLSAIPSLLAGYPRRIFDAARNAIVFVRNTMGHLSGADQHAEAVKLLSQGFSAVPKWGIHAIVGLAFGWVEKHMPTSLQPAIGEIAQELEAVADAAVDRLTAPPLAVFPAPAQPPTPVGVGESLPPPAAPPQDQAILRPSPIPASPPLRPQAGFQG